MAPVLRLQRWILGSVFGVLAGLGASAFASTIDIAQTPLFLTVDVKPNIMVIVDDSGSMDSEVLFPTNDGALWWHTGNQSYTGLDNNDDSSAGTINFNKVGTAGDTWKKYVYLFPNGTATGDRVYADQTNDHYAIAPIPAYAYARSPDFNAAYFDPGETYEPWAGYGDTTFGQIDPTSAPSDPVRGTYRFNLT
jgi:type IV pilus assembly protein PilY1